MQKILELRETLRKKLRSTCMFTSLNKKRRAFECLVHQLEFSDGTVRYVQVLLSSYHDSKERAHDFARCLRFARRLRKLGFQVHSSAQMHPQDGMGGTVTWRQVPLT